MSAVFTTSAHCTARGCDWVHHWQTRNLDAADTQLAYAEQLLAQHREEAQHPAPKPVKKPRTGVTWRGETHSVAEWARIVGVTANTMYWRISAWGVDAALSTGRAKGW